MLRLPVSRREVVLRPLDGIADLLILEAPGSVLQRALSLLGRIAQPANDDDDADWSLLPVTDFEVLLASLRRAALGPDVACVFDCPAPGCGERVEVRFGLAEFVATARPRQPTGVVAASKTPWFCLADSPVSFRLPTAGDQCAVFGRAGAARLLAERCLDPPETGGILRRRIERAMALMAPEVSRLVAGHCPACGAHVRAGLHLPTLVMIELRRAAAGLHDEVHRLASAYHWDEAAILALPQRRRQAYAERAAQAAVGAA
jgi:hypothetical protein